MLFLSEQVLCLLLLRGDLSKAEAREKASEYVSNAGSGGGGDGGGVRVKSILSQVTNAVVYRVTYQNGKYLLLT